MQEEIWKDVPNYEGLYQVSNIGNVISLRCGKKSNMKLCNDGNNYLYVGLSKNNKRKNIKVHKLVAMAFLNHKPNGTLKIVIDHINNDSLDNRLENLQIITQRENAYKNQGKYTSQYKGVSFIKKYNKWMATIYLNKKNKNLGLFNNEYDAYLAYQNKLKEIELC